MSEFFRNSKRILAPLVGGSDLAFRLLCRKYGAQLTFTEMCIVSTWMKPERRRDLFEFHASDRPLFLQLTDTKPEPIIEMANMDMFKGHVDGIDLNFGCPQHQITKRGCGAGLLIHFGVDYCVDLVEKVVKGVNYPVSVKTRLYKDIPTTIDFLQKLINVGVCAITIHGRYPSQKGSNRGECDWEAIDTIRKALKPKDFVIIGNGDVKTFDQLQHRLNTSLVDGVMIGYGALRDPRVFGETNDSVEEVVREYVALARRHRNKLIDVQRHLGWLTKGLFESKLEKFNLFNAENLDEIQTVLKSLNTPIDLQLPSLKERENDKIVFKPTKKIFNTDVSIENLSNKKRKQLALDEKRTKRYLKRQNQIKQKHSTNDNMNEKEQN
mmetsp:Transcript_6310/g.10887  ORF Transcript_6310/g.10887 Transcript_6310/m.10887 type:complete len:381 (-) Transcript_6310:848-1990(-)